MKWCRTKVFFGYLASDVKKSMKSEPIENPFREGWLFGLTVSFGVIVIFLLIMSFVLFLVTHAFWVILAIDLIALAVYLVKTIRKTEKDCFDKSGG